jgi:predicted RNA binding protein YcfA (HicA-like mRNA interferase family)
MRLPRDVSGAELVKALKKFGYESTRHTGSHIRLTTQANGEYHVTIPKHQPLRIGTLASILDSVASHAALTRDELIRKLDL